MNSIVGGIVLFLGFLGGIALMLDFLSTWEIHIINLILFLLSLAFIYLGTKLRQSARASSIAALPSIAERQKSKRRNVLFLVIGAVAFVTYGTVTIGFGGFDIPSGFLLAVLGWLTYLFATDVFEARKRDRGEN